MPIDAEAILSIPLCTRNIPDFWAWSAEKKGGFSVRSAYRLIIHTKIARELWIDEEEGTSATRYDSSSWL